MDNRYSEHNLPNVGDIVLNPNGREYRVVRVYGAHNVACRKVGGKELKNYQANDLRVNTAAVVQSVPSPIIPMPIDLELSALVQKWLSNPKAHTCSCQHVAWAHWSNGKCAHCNCESYDGEPDPSAKGSVQH